MERREAEELMPPPPPVVVDVNKPMKMDESFAALLANGSTSLPGIPGMVGAAPAPSGDRSYVGLAVDPKTRGLVAVENDVTKKKHENHAAAAAAGVPLWITIENDVAWEWFKELDDDSSGELDMAEAKQLCVKLNLKVKNFANVFAELDTGGDGTVSFTNLSTGSTSGKQQSDVRCGCRSVTCFRRSTKIKAGASARTRSRCWSRNPARS